MIVTTARKQAHRLESEAKKVAEQLQATFCPRGNQSIAELKQTAASDVFIVGKGRLSLYPKEGAPPFFYHPNSANLRYKQWRHSGRDPLIDASELKADDRFLDCTLGMGADATVAKLAVGEKGLVVGCEADPRIALITGQGLRSWADADARLLEAMPGVHVVHSTYLAYLKDAVTDSFDVVYFDPMFETALTNSCGIQGLRSFASFDALCEEAVNEARRVASRFVVLKDHYLSSRFEHFGFDVHKRQHAAFHYGVIKTNTLEG
ncbi:class I SAM-dependent methyltransferase [Shouchella shacheensis]|uniref:class I SAM-dependent methyltransferase n=1 Tax=Shouchella shacheensis TaxID=1649580 RepID=UPI0007402D6A|nr:class I SAM-dependent methyltransferase [Shouchella shacheensis]